MVNNNIHALLYNLHTIMSMCHANNYFLKNSLNLGGPRQQYQRNMIRYLRNVYIQQSEAEVTTFTGLLNSSGMGIVTCNNECTHHSLHMFILSTQVITCTVTTSHNMYSNNQEKQHINNEAYFYSHNLYNNN